MQRKTVVRRCQTVNVPARREYRLTRRFPLRAQDGLSDDGHRLTDGLSDGRGLREGGGAFLPLPLRTCAQARARVLVALDCYGRLPYLVACLRALVAGAWLMLAKGRAEETSAGARADARLRTHAHENPPSAPREASHVR